MYFSHTAKCICKGVHSPALSKVRPIVWVEYPHHLIIFGFRSKNKYCLSTPASYVNSPILHQTLKMLHDPSLWKICSSSSHCKRNNLEENILNYVLQNPQMIDRRYTQTLASIHIKYFVKPE